MTGYIEQGTICQGGDPGGDLQAGTSWCRRFVKPLEDGTFAVVDVTTYGIITEVNRDDGSTYPDYDVREQVEFTHCTDAQDPGSSEIFSWIEYAWPFDFAPEDAEIAEDWAKNHVISFDPAHLDWNPVA